MTNIGSLALTDLNENLIREVAIQVRAAEMDFLPSVAGGILDCGGVGGFTFNSMCR